MAAATQGETMTSLVYPETVPKGDETCRLCLRVEYSLIMIFAQEETSKRLRSRILDCCPVKLLEDVRLPNAICHDCEKKVAAIYEFREQCRESERILRLRYESCYTTEDSPENAANRAPVWDRTIQMYGWSECGMAGPEKEDNEGAVDGDGETEGRKERWTCRCAAKLSLSEPVRQSAVFEKNFRVEQEQIEEGKVDISIAVVESRESLQPLVQPVSLNRIETDERGSDSGKIGTMRQDRRHGHYRFREKATTSKVSEARYLCDICSRTFLSKSGLRFHLKSHNGTKPYLCRYCGKGFAIPSYVKRHESVHSNEKRFVCHVCSAKFASPNGLRYHLRMHTGEANYRCKVCCRSFRRRKYLTEHEYTHTGEKPYACKRCGSSYRNSGSLFVHEKACKSDLERSLATKTNPRFSGASYESRFPCSGTDFS